jgi:hypothetical protein
LTRIETGAAPDGVSDGGTPPSGPANCPRPLNPAASLRFAGEGPKSGPVFRKFPKLDSLWGDLAAAGNPLPGSGFKPRMYAQCCVITPAVP